MSHSQTPPNPSAKPRTLNPKAIQQVVTTVRKTHGKGSIMTLNEEGFDDVRSFPTGWRGQHRVPFESRMGPDSGGHCP